jgi:hypothetical protein
MFHYTESEPLPLQQRLCFQLLQAMNKRRASDLILLDLSPAFDTMDHYMTSSCTACSLDWVLVEMLTQDVGLPKRS